MLLLLLWWWSGPGSVTTRCSSDAAPTTPVVVPAGDAMMRLRRRRARDEVGFMGLVGDETGFVNADDEEDAGDGGMLYCCGYGVCMDRRLRRGVTGAGTRNSKVGGLAGGSIV